MHHFYLCFFCCLLLLSSSIGAQTYSAAESAEYDPLNGRWLVSNGNIIIDDGQGNLSYFGSAEATANYGMEVMENTLFAVTGSSVVAYDLTTAAEVGRVTITGAGFLNGLTSDGAGTLYVTDFSNREIHKITAADLSNMSAEEIVSNTIVTPNGIVYDAMNDRLVFTDFGGNAKLTAVDLSDYSLTTLVNTGLGSIDGIDEDAEGNFYVSSWNPAQISKYDNNFANPLEVITTPFISRPADIGYAQAIDTLAIPIGDDVIFVGFETVSALSDGQVAAFGFKVYSNPVSDLSYLQFSLDKAQEVDLDIIDSSGRVLRGMLSGRQSEGIHKVLLAGNDLAAGTYFCRLVVGNKQAIQLMVVQ